MKKSIVRRTSVVLATIMSVSLMMFGCNRKIDVDYGYESKNYITKLGDYKGITYTPDNSVVDDSEVESHIKSILTSSAEWNLNPSDKIEMGDKVNIQISATDDDGAYLPEFSVEDDYELILGSGYMSKNYEGFEEALVGMLPGFTKKVKCKVTDTFVEPEYRGKDISFTVAITSAYKGDIPEFTDEFVKTTTNGKYNTTDEYRAAVRKNYENKLEEEKHTARYAEVIEQIMDNTEVSGYPEARLQEQIAANTKSMGIYSAMFSMTEEEYCQQMFNCSIEEYAKKVILQEMILQEVVKAEGLTLTTKEYKDNLESFAKKVGYSSSELLLQYYDENYVKKNMLLQKAMDVIYDASVPKA